MARGGQIARVAKDIFCARPRAKAREGKLSFNGRAYLVDTESGPIRVSPGELGGAVAGDVVSADVTFDNGRGKREGRIDGIVETVRRTITGTARKVGRNVVVYSSEIGEPVIVLEGGNTPDAGDQVTIEIGGRPRLRKRIRDIGPNPLVGEIVDGAVATGTGVRAADAFAYVERGEMRASVLLSQLAQGLGVDREFSEAALQEARSVAIPVGVPEGCDDLVDKLFMTIDPDDAKDFDDALYAEPGPDGTIRLWVAIADVSAYVSDAGALNEEALERSFSVYMPGRVYPMLPPELSENVCSLRPNELRRCAWVRMDIGKRGACKEYDAGFGVMKSRARLTYDQAQAALDGDARLEDEALQASLELLEDIRKRRYAYRVRRGVLDLDLPEPRISLTEDGDGVQQVQPYPRFAAHRLVEECMLLANESIADLLASRECPGVYRAHGKPSLDRLNHFRRVARTMGVRTELSDEPTAQELTEVIEGFRDHPRGRILSFLLLRALAKAQYTVEEDPHYGIGAGLYLHFTSPIRRFPDLAVHRILRRHLDRGCDPDENAELTESLRAVCSAANAGEKLADQAERYSDRLLQALHMVDRVGETFDGVVSDLAPFGAFVSLTDPYVNGLIPMSNLGDDYFVFDEEKLRIFGRIKGGQLRLGDEVRVRCTEVQVHEGKITFERI